MTNGMTGPLASLTGNAFAGDQQAQQQTTRDVKFASIDSAVAMEPSQKPEQEDNANKGKYLILSKVESQRQHMY